MRLPAGSYVLSGRFKTAALKPFSDPRGTGAGIRIGGGGRTNTLSGNTDWTVVEFPIELTEARDLEWVAEIRADAGEAWIEMNSLRLKRK